MNLESSIAQSVNLLTDRRVVNSNPARGKYFNYGERLYLSHECWYLYVYDIYIMMSGSYYYKPAG